MDSALLDPALRDSISATNTSQAKCQKAYFKWRNSDDAALVEWFTYVDSSGHHPNARDFTLNGRAKAAQRAFQQIPALQDRPLLTVDKIKSKLANMIAAYKKARDWLNQTGQGLLDSQEQETGYVMSKLSFNQQRLSLTCA